MSKIQKITGLVATAIVFSACTEKMAIPLKDATPVVMIEGNISDRTDIPALVLISKTTTYNDTSFFKGLSGAVVTINDGVQTDTLSEMTVPGFPAGVYANLSLKAQAGKTYTLSVLLDGKLYQAVSQTPEPVAIDSLFVSEGIFDREDSRITCVFRDPAGVKNYYKADLWVNRKFQPQVNISNDELTDGTIKRINMNTRDICEPGDTVDVYLTNIDKNVYTFFYTLDNANAGSAAPANPVSNISGDCLGYFSAYSSSHRKMIYP